MPIKKRSKKVLVKKPNAAVKKTGCSIKKVTVKKSCSVADSCCCQPAKGMTDLSSVLIFGGLIVAVFFFLLPIVF